jgi:hypothetical protein
MNKKTSALLTVGAVWILLALVFFLARFSIGIPGWMPFWAFIVVFSAFELILGFGWIVPMAIGVILLVKSRQKSKQLTTESLVTLTFSPFLP